MQVVVVVVLYKVIPDNSATVRSLKAEIQAYSTLFNEIEILLWDNSPESLDVDDIPTGFAYIHSRANDGVSGAYNSALHRAMALSCPWLLLLDQDSELPLGYLQRLLDHAQMLLEAGKIAAIVPFVRSNDVLVSPRRSGWTLRSSQVEADASGVLVENGFAINSGTLMRVSALESIGGYSRLFWLDLSDQYVFRKLYQAGFVMYLAADLTIGHSIASSDYDRNMSVERYRSFLAAENLFTRTFHSALSNAAHDVVLLARAARQYRRYRNKAFAWSTLRSFRQRVFLSNHHGLNVWKNELGERNMPLVGRQQTKRRLPS
jgi:GT2 family glycosyltransferase